MTGTVVCGLAWHLISAASRSSEVNRVAGSFQDVLDQLRSTSDSEQELGDRFERLMLAFLQADQFWFTKYSSVWRWIDWPGRQGEADTGIDLIAEHRDGSGFTAVQCKCYQPTSQLDMKDLGTFFTRSGKSPFTERLIIATTNRWTKNLLKATHGQDKPTVRLGVADLEDSAIDWSQWDLNKTKLKQKRRKDRRPHQKKAIKAVIKGLQTSDRGKLVMACGTGKTFTGLQIAEELAGEGGSVLVLLPSISLLSQTLKEWAADAGLQVLPFAVCSDAQAGKRRKTEDLSPNDLLLPATTDPEALLGQWKRATAEQLKVVFSTYQSTAVITEAQKMGLGDFDLIICDEAHRTTGVTLADEEESHFTRVHDNKHIAAKKRLYMTATPRVYADTSKAKADAADADVKSMDDEAIFGPELFRLGFREAVDLNLLSDYKVLILAVDEEAIAQAFQQQLSDENHELKLDDATRIVGCLNALSKRNAFGTSFSERDNSPMKTAVAFSTTIKQSKKFKDLFDEVAKRYAYYCDQPFEAEVEHVDGSFNALQREDLIAWLKEGSEERCRILSNARCLTEGIDVPALDSIIFLEPRNSMVDVIQAVGRVMRRAPDKELGYVILPIGIPTGITPEEALNDNKRFKVVWQVLNALRSHDDRLNAVVNKLDLNDEAPEMVDVQVVGLPPTEDDQVGEKKAAYGPKQLELQFPVDELRQAIYAQLVKKVGTRHYWEDWASDIAQIASRHEARLRALLEDKNLKLNKVFQRFVVGLRKNLNDSISRDDAIGMLSQHLITRPVFEALFEGYDFVGSNPVSRSMQAMLDKLDKHALDKETETLDRFYSDVKLRAEGIDNAAGKQQIITELYERFFSKALPKTAEALGIVYTPVEVVDFILHAAEDALQKHFGASISDEGVHVLDPFTGTGTFIVRLLQSGLISKHDLARKYASEVHANEILLLAYYIAAVNIESTYHQLTGAEGQHKSFPGIVYTDTFHLSEASAGQGELDIFPINNERAAKQQQLDIRVIIGNPPYSAGQESANDIASSASYPRLDDRITSTYAARSSATLKNSLYDSYIRALRWASDRILAHADGGIIAFVSNGGFLDGNTADGLRLTLVQEYNHLYVLNLRGNQRVAGEQSRKEGGKVFGSGSRATVAVIVAVKEPGNVPSTGAQLHYHDIGDYLTRSEKFAALASATESSHTLGAFPWRRIETNKYGDWLNQRSDRFLEYPPINDAAQSDSVFGLRTNGLKTNRDAWNYNSSRTALVANAKRMVEFFNSEVDRLARMKGRVAIDASEVKKLADLDPKKFSWIRADFKRLLRGKKLSFEADSIYPAAYRPFFHQWANTAPQLNDAVGKIQETYPSAEARELAFWFPAPGSMAPPFCVLMTDRIADNGFYASSGTVGVPRNTFSSQNEATLFGRVGQVTNVNHSILESLQKLDRAIGADDVFFYAYGILHSDEYRRCFATDLRKSLPRLPIVDRGEDFWEISRIGRALSDLHVGYESVEPWPDLEVLTSSGNLSASSVVEKLRYQKVLDAEVGKRVEDKTVVVVNSTLSIAGIPMRAHSYRLGSRSAIDWVLRQFEVRQDKESGIRNDPNLWGVGQGLENYIPDLLKRIVTVSMRTLDLVEQLPLLRL